MTLNKFSHTSWLEFNGGELIAAAAAAAATDAGVAVPLWLLLLLILLTDEADAFPLLAAEAAAFKFKADNVVVDVALLFSSYMLLKKLIKFCTIITFRNEAIPL